MPRCRAARPLAALLGGCAVLAAWGAGEPGPAPQPTASFVTALSGAGEAPAAGAPNAGGVAQVTISGTTVFYTLIVQGLASVPTAAHIHRGLLGSSGPVVMPFPTPFVSGISSGTTTITAALAAEILSNPAGFYVNAHTVEFPGGAVRGVPGGARAAGGLRARHRQVARGGKAAPA